LGPHRPPLLLRFLQVHAIGVYAFAGAQLPRLGGSGVFMGGAPREAEFARLRGRGATGGRIFRLVIRCGTGANGGRIFPVPPGAKIRPTSASSRGGPFDALDTCDSPAYSSNMDISLRRAASVMGALVFVLGCS
ncbi:MAG: hypothetical protein ACK56I_36660, partial [bacterium]